MELRRQAADLVAVGVPLGAEHVALRAGLLFEDAALILPVASVGSGREVADRVEEDSFPWP